MPSQFIPNSVAGNSKNPNAKIVIPKAYSMKSLFSGNTYYSKNTSYSGVGSVSNIRRIKKMT